MARAPRRRSRTRPAAAHLMMSMMFIGVGAFLLIGSGCDAVVRSGLSEPQANQLLVALDAAAISGHKLVEPGGSEARYRVEVPPAELTAALRVVQQQQLPSPEPPSADKLLQASGLVATPAEERARLSAATAGELARSLARFEGVVDARVHLVLPDALRPLDAPLPPTHAAVLLVRERSAPPVDETVVRSLVSAAVSGLAPSAVSIVQTRAAAPAPAAGATVRVGPFSVRRESAPLLRAVLALALLLDLAMAVALIWTVRRKRAVVSAMITHT